MLLVRGCCGYGCGCGSDGWLLCAYFECCDVWLLCGLLVGQLFACLLRLTAVDNYGLEQLSVLWTQQTEVH